MVDQRTKRRVAQYHMDAIELDSGPIYGVRLLHTLPLGSGGMVQALPSRDDLKLVSKLNTRTAAGYEVLLSHYQAKCEEVSRLRDVIQQVINGDWVITELQEAIGMSSEQS